MMNKVILIGNLTRDPELTETPSGVAVCRFAIAVSRDYANADGTRETDFFNITVWRGRAENCGKYLKKGNKVAVIGSLQNRSYEDKDGIKRNVTDVVANEVEFLTPKNAQSDVDSDAPVMSARRERPQLEAIDDNQLPF
ncbi:MAG: single-stranded DNA-binding protein [Clostridia bacterium]|nr:single-stranded DNA-binding protein [Clostridia bacterium]MBR2449045.1 single-stranded DNA-binding protein [Clostridia bacterium]